MLRHGFSQSTETNPNALLALHVSGVFVLVLLVSENSSLYKRSNSDGCFPKADGAERQVKSNANSAWLLELFRVLTFKVHMNLLAILATLK